MRRANSLTESLMLGKTGGEGPTEDEVVGWHHGRHGHELEQAPGEMVKDRKPVGLQPTGSQRGRHD